MPRTFRSRARGKLEKNEFLTDFFIDYGLPGKADYEYTRPFDYFSFQATASSANGFENVMTRGLLWGRSYGEDVRYRGIWGLYGNYDYIAPQTYRISTTGLSLGTTGEWRMRHGMALLGTALLGTGYAAAGTVRSSDTNDFHYGVAPQALLALRWIIGTRAAIDLAGGCRLHVAHRGPPRDLHQVSRQPARFQLPRHRRPAPAAPDHRPLLHLPRPRPLRLRPLEIMTPLFT